MDMSQMLHMHGEKRFVCDGLDKHRAYMVIDGTAVYIQASDMELAEGLSLNDLQPLIQSLGRAEQQ